MPYCLRLFHIGLLRITLDVGWNNNDDGVFSSALKSTDLTKKVLAHDAKQALFIVRIYSKCCRKQQDTTNVIFLRLDCEKPRALQNNYTTEKEEAMP